MAKKIAVLLGGTSAERDVSLASGLAIAAALRGKGYDVTAIDCAYGARRIEASAQPAGDIIRVQPSDIEARRQELNRNILETVRFLLDEKYDAAFIALHGGYGENGQLQALLELSGIPFTGSGSLASALGMDKHYSKLIFEKNGIPTASWIKLTDADKRPDLRAEAEDYPVVVKPNDQGSTVGLTVVRRPEEMETAIKKAFGFGRSVIVEKFISGREMTVSILDGKALPVIEIIPESGIYDYEHKYQSGRSRYVVPAEISPEITQRMQDYAAQAFRALGCRHYARVDFRLQENGDMFCLEVNTLPGMTATSLVPKAARAAGMEFPDLIDKIVRRVLQ